MAANLDDTAPIISDVLDFDHGSGSLVERLLFNNRPIILFLCLIATLILGFEATHIKLNASFEKMIPRHQPFIVNFYNHYADLQSQGNAIDIAVQADNGTIINAHYLEVLKELNDKIYLLPNVDRAFMTSLWTPSTRWVSVVSDGLASGPVIDSGSYDGSPAQLNIVAQNIAKTGKIGEIVSNDFTSSMIHVPLLQYDGLTGKQINYGQLATELNGLRKEYAAKGVKLHIIGFGMVVGDMINGIGKILTFFAVSAIIATAMLFWFTRCIRSTLLVVSASIIAVIWQMGFLPLLGYDLTPYSVLVPFLVFAIGMSHGAQKMNGVMQDIGRGAHPLVAARFTFRRLFMAGFAALVCDASSFAVLLTIRIGAIQELALLASIGVGILIFTNLIMLPMVLSYTGVSKKAAARSLRNEGHPDARIDYPLWNFLDKFTHKEYAVLAIVVAVILGGVGIYVGKNVQVGDIDKGAPELRQDSQYNIDNAYIINHYSTSSDKFVVLVDTPNGDCIAYPTLYAMSNLQWELEQMPQVQSTYSLGSFAAQLTMLLTENSPKWYEIVKNQDFLGDFTEHLTSNVANFDCNFAPIYVYLVDHKAATLNAVIRKVQSFIKNPQNQSPDFKISLAGGNAGIDAATNIVIEQANEIMLILVYSTVILFCFIVFRSWRAVLCAVLPLILTSILAQALMVWLGIGIKVATLPVMALGVGIGVDYALYVLGIVIKQLRAGASLSHAYHRTLLFTGKVVLLTGFTLAAGVVTWIFAPIKFQADMGLLLSFMFLWNMMGAMILLPSLAYFLLPPKIFDKAS
ncbi:RND family transporter [Acidocella sp. KAb 2-4]|uniref:efflux RND transporter permease subunit n=1 Tax=Acidocella sp. KAb 2-4 TaxID=2885158 RepID=UPI001D065D70|nr:MMPL family transporter [Acidocella sp. KAb 2-4]MCB5945644.1 MMPL family transporter [Acidocella sp. KAb 2-4]